MKHIAAYLCLLFIPNFATAESKFVLDHDEVFTMPGLDITVFSDAYPEGHQTGITIIQHGKRVAANGDLRLEASPGQWSPVPRSNLRKLDAYNQIVTQNLAYPDPMRNRKGFNPIEYPRLNLTYSVSVQPLKGSSFEIVVNLNKPLPPEWVNKVGFNLELMPSEYYGKSFKIGGQFNLFQRQPSGPIQDYHGEYLQEFLGEGKELIIAPEDPLKKITITSKTAPLQLFDGRSTHNNGWFIVRSLVAANTTKNAVRWVVTPNVEADWMYPPVVQVSQVGYRPKHQKQIVVEQDKRDKQFSALTLFEITENGNKPVLKAAPKLWGDFLRYGYGVLDFSFIDKPGMYVAEYRGKYTHPFQISDTVYQRQVWQPSLEYFLPIQMCHMRVEEKRRVWHDLCHQDDAIMAPTRHNHFDGYFSEPSTFTNHAPKDRVAKLQRGGWHDAGDFDIRIESQAKTIWLLAQIVEQFNITLDSTTIDQQNQKVLIHQPDGKADALQQIEHGLISLLGSYQSLGRLYRGIISPTVEQYSMMGDPSAQTDGLIYDASLTPEQIKHGKSGKPDDRWVFTENNPDRALLAAAAIAAASRVIKDSNSKMALIAQKVATDTTLANLPNAIRLEAKVFALVELYKTTHDPNFLKILSSLKAEILTNIADTGWHLARIKSDLASLDMLREVNEAVVKQQKVFLKEAAKTPYGVPYASAIWGDGWNILDLGIKQYFLHKSWPQYVTNEVALNALNFVLGVHPGENQQSFVSGVGAQSALVAYGFNRGDWSHIPGGVISGTALIKPDLPELKRWPYLWQQSEYLINAAPAFIFLTLAANSI